MEWQPIETAPKDKEILVAYVGNVMIARYSRALNGFPARWIGPYPDDFTYGGPTHWMPLPEPPT